MENSQFPVTRSFQDQVFVWDSIFESRRKEAYSTEEVNLSQDDATAVTAFLSEGRSRLDPPDHNYTALRAFLEQANEAGLFEDPPIPKNGEIVALLDERRDTTGWKDIMGYHHPARDWEGYASYPPEGECRPAVVLNAYNLYQLLQTSRQASGAERRIIYIADISPLACLALASSSSIQQAPILRDFLQRHISRHAYFGVAMPFGFALEFHLPYFALRYNDQPKVDKRGLRRYGEFIPSRRPQQSREYFYEAQISFLVTGIDEWFWTAFCCVDTYFGSEEKVEFYHARGLDAPTGGSKMMHYPVWNPREYFLLVLSRRFRQSTKEWHNLVTTLDARLQFHEENVFREAQRRHPLVDDPNFSRTRDYTWTIELLRVLHNALMKLIESWESFERGELRYFEVAQQKIFYSLWNSYLADIEKDLTEIRSLRRSLQQRIEMFEYMRNGLVNSSSMAESRVATLQGTNIARLTRVTVAYLPLSLGTAVFSMVMIPDKGSWIAYALVLASLLSITLAIAFRSQMLVTLIRQLRETVWEPIIC